VKIRSILGPGCAVLTATVVVVALAQSPSDRNPAWPAIMPNATFSEWYSDLPWNQKLGTYTGNQLDEAIIMPYGARPQADRVFCTSKKLSPADCMIEVGVNNVLGMQRVDTPYAPFPQNKVPDECKDASQPCIEVLLHLSNFYAKSSGGNVALAKRVFGPALPDSRGDFSAYTVSDGSTYAPQMPWFTAHYCENMFKAFPSKPKEIPDIQDPVCYADYFSPFNNGFNYLPNIPSEWPRAAPWSPWPQSSNNHCAAGSEVCTLAFAGFDLREVPESFDENLQYFKYNNFLLQWFNYGLKGFKEDVSVAENQRKFPWTGNPVTWKDFYYYSAMNPFLGTFDNVNTVGPNVPGCDTTLTGPTIENCTTTAQYRASHTLYPRQCGLADLASGDAKRLRKCGLNYEFHHNGWISQWPADWEAAIRAAQMYPSNQYGRTSFLFAGVPGMQLPVSFYKSPDSPSGMSVYEQVYNTSVFSLYLPIANEADQKRAYSDRQYNDKTFYHTLLMTNHMEAEPDVFADGIRGKALWHNEYRMQGMYDDWKKSPATSRFPPVTFNASFDESKALAPFHGSTCDSCHVRNGSGIPINTRRTLDAAQQVFMSSKEYNAAPVQDYTFTGKIHPMKLVFFDLGRNNPRGDGSKYSVPLAFTPLTTLSPPRNSPQVYYSNAIMNFYGDAFHVTKAPFDYAWSYEAAGEERLVVKTKRTNPELGITYTPWQVKVGSFTTGTECSIVKKAPINTPWPTTCDDVNGAAIENAIAEQQVGYMLLNGKRLGNSSAIEAMPDDAIIGFRDAQNATFGEALAGELIWTVGSRNGVDGVVRKDCRPNDPRSCFIGRFGWLGDRASLEDQVANAAFVEMNMTSSEGYKKLYGENGKTTTPIRYLTANCGPANASCFGKPGNSDLSERDIERMADYSRWIGNPTRSEFQVQLPEVMAGEKVFRSLQCDSCHVIKKIPIDTAQTMLSNAYVKRLANRVQGTGPDPIRPFLSYLGTDLLMHDMGYLSQVGIAPGSIRNDDGTVKPEYKNFVQKIRTPALKGMRFNRFITDSHRNVKNPGDPACDFLMHDGRACDAIEAAFMHDGPAVKKIGMIEALTSLKPADVTNLRAFLYSL
jgi:CxxC motif-containing protein (DUF1111 family)